MLATARSFEEGVRCQGCWLGESLSAELRAGGDWKWRWRCGMIPGVRIGVGMGRSINTKNEQYEM